MNGPMNERQWRPGVRWYGRELMTRIFSGIFFAIIILQFGATLTGHTSPLQWLLHGNRMLVYLSVIGALIVLSAIGGGITAARAMILLRRLARRPGWSYRRRETGLDERWTHSPFDGNTHSPYNSRNTRIGPIAQGPIDGVRCRIFGYRYSTGSGDHESRHQTWVFTVELPGRLPYLRVGPESLRGAVTPGLAAMDVDTENETFNRRYRVLAGEPAFAHAVLNPRVIEALLSIEPFTWQIDGADLIATGALPSRTDLEHKIDVLHEMGRQIPGFLYRA